MDDCGELQYWHIEGAAATLDSATLDSATLDSATLVVVSI